MADELENRLPKSHDGKPIIPCIDDVWIRADDNGAIDPDEYLDPGEIYGPFRGTFWSNHWCLFGDGWEDGLYWNGPVYSSLEAAKEAGA